MRVLVADDCESTLEILKMNLSKWGYEPMLVTDGEQALRIMKSPAGPRLALLDWNMPKIDGVSVCRELRTRTENALNYSYIIVLTAMEGEEHLVEALESGADDYLSKPVHPRELQLRVRTGERILELQNRVVQTNRKLAKITTLDQLTLTLNRQTFLRRLAEEFERSLRKGHSVSVVFMEVDDLQQITEEYGRKTGDEILRQSAERFRRAARGYDVLGRMGDQEFGVIMPETELGMGVALCERLRNSICDQPFLIQGNVVETSLSVGIASSSTEGLDRNQLLTGSSRAVAKAKAVGGDRTLIWEAGIVLDPMQTARSANEPQAVANAEPVTTE